MLERIHSSSVSASQRNSPKARLPTPGRLLQGTKPSAGKISPSGYAANRRTLTGLPRAGMILGTLAAARQTLLCSSSSYLARSMSTFFWAANIVLI
jgi:hypothetical protein